MFGSPPLKVGRGAKKKKKKKRNKKKKNKKEKGKEESLTRDKW